MSVLGEELNELMLDVLMLVNIMQQHIFGHAWPLGGILVPDRGLNSCHGSDE